MTELGQRIVELFCWHKFIDRGRGYVLFNGFGLYYGMQAKLKANYRQCSKCQRMEYSLLETCKNGLKRGRWYRDRHRKVIRKLKYDL